MRNLINILLLAILLCSACSLSSLKEYNGNVINLPSGMRLVEASLNKDSSVWMYMETVDSNYTPKVKILQETSKYGIIKRKLIFKESK